MAKPKRPDELTSATRAHRGLVIATARNSVVAAAGLGKHRHVARDTDPPL
jgi:hypothetical protein